MFFLFFPNAVLTLIHATDEMRSFGASSFRILSISLFINGLSICLSQCFPPAKRSYLTMIYSVLRQVGLLIPLSMLFTKLWGSTGVWIALTLTDYLAFFIVLGMSIWFRKTVLNKWDNTETQQETTK